MGANADKQTSIAVHLKNSTVIAGNIYAPTARKLAAERMVVQERMEWTRIKHADSIICLLLYLGRQSSIVFFVTS